MTGGFWGKIDQAGRNIAPLAVTVALMLVGMTPLHLPELFDSRPGTAADGALLLGDPPARPAAAQPRLSGSACCRTC